MASHPKTPYYYKSPVRKSKQDKDTEAADKSGTKNTRRVSKSPTVSSQATGHGMPQSILAYVKLMDELKVVCNTIDESTVEINHLVELFNKREATLKTDEAKDEAKRLREVYSIPEEI
jgi:hypothetical protein